MRLFGWDKMRRVSTVTTRIGTLLRRGGSRLAQSPDDLSRHPTAKLAVLLGTAIACSLILAPRRTPTSYPVDENAIGTVATSNAKAPRDVTILDEEKTTRRRTEVMAKALPVYDHDVPLSQQLGERIAQAFAAARELRPKTADAHPAIANNGSAPLPASESTAAEQRQQFETTLPVSITDAEFQALREAGFAEPLGRALAAVVAALESGLIVADRRLMLDGAELGVIVQAVPLGRGPDLELHDFALVSDVASARAVIGTKLQQHLTPAGVVPPALVTALTTIAERCIRPNLTFNRAETEVRRARLLAGVLPVQEVIKQGEMIIRDGDKVQARHLAIFRALAEQRKPVSIVRIVVGFTLLFMIVAWGAYAFAGLVADAPLVITWRDTLVFALALLAECGALRLSASLNEILQSATPLLSPTLLLYALPTMAGAMLLRLLIGKGVAFVFSLLLGLVVGLSFDEGSGLTVYLLLGSLTACHISPRWRQRTRLLRTGLLTAGTNVACILALATINGRLWGLPTLLDLAAGVAAGLFAAMLVSGLVPLLESFGGYVTFMRLLDLADLNHPVLREFMVQAPGSHHHAMVVGTMAETAAEGIGANPLLARVMAYYHDIGKSNNPRYFAENQVHGDNPHDKLEPSMSALILKRHISDGLTLATQHGLGAPIEAAILEHHGTTRMGVFYEKAKAEETEGAPVNEVDFRYPGQLPQSRESALVMLADSVEAAARAMGDPNPARLMGVVQKVINAKFSDGQLNECDLTLRDLNVIAREFTNVLVGIHHTRPEYAPQNRTGEVQRMRHHVGPDSKSKKRANGTDDEDPPASPDSLKRLGLS